MKVYKIFLDLYYDNFGIYRNIYYLLKDVYLQFENMLTYQRKLLKNHLFLNLYHLVIILMNF